MITTRFLDGTAMKSTIRWLSILHVTPTGKAIRICSTCDTSYCLCFCPALWRLLLCRTCSRSGWFSSDELPINSWVVTGHGGWQRINWHQLLSKNCLTWLQFIAVSMWRIWKEIKEIKNIITGRHKKCYHYKEICTNRYKKSIAEC